VRALAGEGVERERQRRDERLALAGLHLGDLAVVERGAADELDVVVAQAEEALRGLAREREVSGMSCESARRPRGAASAASANAAARSSSFSISSSSALTRATTSLSRRFTSRSFWSNIFWMNPSMGVSPPGSIDAASASSTAIRGETSSPSGRHPAV
jgi:hypothetical protein